MQIADIHKSLLRRILIMIVLITAGAAMITVTIYMQERRAGPLLDKSVNFHSVAMHDVNKLIVNLNDVRHDVENGKEASASLQQLATAGHTLDKFSAEMALLYRKYEFKEGSVNLAELLKNTGQLRQTINRTTVLRPEDVPALLDQMRGVLDKLQQLYRLHETSDIMIREQLARYQLQSGRTLPLFALILLASGVLIYLLIKNIRLSLATQQKLEEELRSIAQRQDFLLSSSPAVIYTCKATGNFAATYISPNFHSEFGYAAEEYLQDPDFWANNIHPADKSQVYKGFKALFENDVYSHQYRFRIPDGTYHWIQDDQRLIRDPDGTPREIIGSWRDINTTKYAEELQRQNEERLKEAQRIVNLGNWELNLLTDTLIWSDEVYRIFEIGKERFHPSYEAFLNLVHPGDRERVKTAYANSLKTQSPYEITHRLLMTDGRIKWVTEHCHTLFDETGTPLRSFGTVQDITYQHNTRLELQTGRAITDELFANLQGMVYRCKNDPDWTLEFVSEGITPLTGYTPMEFVEDRSVHFGQLIHPEDAERVWNTVQEGINHHTVYDIKYRIRTRSGAIKWVTERGHGVFTDDGQLLYLQGLVIDDTQRKQAEQDLELAHTAINKSKSAFFWINLEGQVIYVNDYACQNLGYSRVELTGMYIWDFDPDFPPEALPPNIERMKQQGAIVFESRHRRKDGTIFPIEVTANYITLGNESHIFTFVQDISERRQKDTELQQSRMLLNAIVENLPSMVFLKDANDLKLTLLNKAGEELLGIPREQFIGRSNYDLFPWEQAEFFTARDQETLRNKTVVDIPEEPITTTNKGIRILHTRKVGIYDADDTPRYLLGISEDITDKKHAEQALRESEEKYRMLMESQWDGVFVSQDYKFIFTNSALPKMLGYAYDEFIGIPFQAVVAPEFLDLWTSRYEQRIGTGPEPPGNYEVRFLRKGGVSDIWVELQAQRIEYGGRPAVHGVIRDITEHRQAENELRKYEHIISDSHNLLSFIDRNYTFQFISNVYLEIFNKKREEIIGHTLVDLYGDEFFLTHQKLPFDHALEGHLSGYETWFDLPTTGRRYLVLNYTPFRESDGRISGVIVNAHDFTERKIAEQALRASEEELRRLNESLEERVTERARELQGERNFIHSVLETASALVFVFDNKGHVIRFNRACEKLTGYRFEEIKDKPFWGVLIPPERAAAMQSMLDNLPRFTQSSRGESEWLTRSGERRLIEWSYSLMHGEDGQDIAYVIGTGIDITERKKSEVTLIQAKEEAERASRAKSQFLSRMSHELRTPMNAILGFSQLLKLDVQDPGQQDYVHEILRASHHLLDLINELLDLSRIEAGRLHVTLEALDPAAVVAEAVNLIWPLVEKKNLALHNETATAHNHPVLADATRLKQVLVNLLSNAAKYNRPGGSIRVDCTLLDENQLRLSITDTGFGIPADKHELLFQPFERLGAEGGSEDGTGIGLALSKRLVEIMGGGLGMKSSVGVGTTFWVDLPRTLQQVTAPPQAQGPVFTEEQRTRILYVEDNAANLRLVQRVLARYPALTLLSAVNGETGLELARAHHPDVILLDIHLPDIDGYEVLQRLRADPATAAVPVVAISADAMPIDIERGFKAGFRYYLTKPINIQELIDTISKVLPLHQRINTPVTRH
jgi:PAS domain S-box-containing protein